MTSLYADAGSSMPQDLQTTLARLQAPDNSTGEEQNRQGMKGC